MAGDRELCRHRLERAQVLAFLEQPGQ
jgi:hypothetical protein